MSTPIPTPRTCGEISCDECNDRYSALAAECDQLRAEVEKVYALVTPVGCDLCGGIFETAQAVSELLARAERAEAELTTERARLDYLLKWDVTFNSREDIDRDMQEAAK